jgi:hypothetical protein
MDTLQSLFPTAEELLALEPEAVAPMLLRLARERRQGGGMFWPEAIMQSPTRLITGEPDGYPFHKKAEVEALVNESAHRGFIAPAPGINGVNGLMVLTRAGEEASASSKAFDRVRAAKSFPKTLLHPAIADNVWSALMRGDLDEAVFKSFKAVEEAVRNAGGSPPQISAWT